MQVSVILPTKGYSPFLETAIDSVLKQLEMGDELIVVSNGAESSAAKNRVEENFQSSFLRVLATGKAGISNALNLGVLSSKNELILRLDSDDEMIEGRVRQQKQWFERNREGVLLGTQVHYVCLHGIQIGTSNFSERPLAKASQFYSPAAIAHPSVGYLKKAFLDAGMYREAYEPAEDLDLWLRLATRGVVANLQEPLTKYRVHGNQLSKLELGSLPSVLKKVFSNYQRAASKRLSLSEQFAVLIRPLKTNRLTLSLSRFVTESGSPSKAIRRMVFRKQCACGGDS